MRVSDLYSLLSPLPDLYCALEIDSFGYFANKAKTRVYRYTTEPKWNEVRGLIARVFVYVHSASVYVQRASHLVRMM